MDYDRFLRYHIEKNADVTISLMETGLDMAYNFGIAEVDEDYQIHGFQEKPKKTPKTIPGNPDRVLASMGIYIFKTDILLNALQLKDKNDFGKDIIPYLITKSKVYAYPLQPQNTNEDYVYNIHWDSEKRLSLEYAKDSSYWRDIGTFDAYWNANMDLTGLNPPFNLYGKTWPINTYQLPAPPAKFNFSNERTEGLRVGKALDSIVAPGSVISGIVRNSVISYYTLIRSWATVEESVIMDYVVVGRYCKIKKAIIDKHNIIPSRTEIGFNPSEERKKFTVTPRGIVVVPKGFFK